MTRTALAVGLAAGAASMLGVPAAAEVFEPGCTADSIAMGDPTCSRATLDVTVDADANVLIVQTTAFDRGAFDEFITVYEGWTGTTEEYLRDSLGATTEPGSDYDYAVGETSVSFSVSVVLGQETGDAMYLGFGIEDDAVVAVIDAWAVTGIDRMSVTFPGPVRESNGVTEGNVVTWDAATIESASALTATSLRAPSGGSSLVPWLAVGLGGLAIAGGATLAWRSRASASA